MGGSEQGKRAHGRVDPAGGTTTGITPALIRQKHGGALRRGGSFGNKGGRPPDEFKREMAKLASADKVLAALDRILSDSGHPSFLRALEYATDRGYGAASRADSGEGSGCDRQLVVIIREELPRRAYEVGAGGAGMLGAEDA